MFSVPRVQSVLPLEREKELEELFEEPSAGTIHSVWGSPGHLFVSFNGGLAMKAFDTAPVDQKPPQGKRSLSVPQATSEILQVCCLNRKDTPVYVAHKNGSLKAWLYSPTGGWVHLGNITLCVSQYAEVQMLTIDEVRGRVVWVESLSTGPQDGCHYSICTRTMTFESTDVKHSAGPIAVLLKNCPKSALYCSPLGLTIWPSDPSPGGLYFTWHSDVYRLKNQLDTYVLGHGRCLSEDRPNVVVDFKTNASALRHIWARTSTRQDLHVVGRAHHLSSGVLFLICSNGCVHSVNGSEETLNVLRLPASVDTTQSTDWFAYRFVLGALVSGHLIRIMSNTTGEILQEIDLAAVSADVDVKLWNAVGTVPRLGMWSSKGIWLLQMDNVASLATIMPKAEAISTLRDFNEARLANRTALQAAYETYTGRSNEGQSRSVDIPCEAFQNEGIAVSLLQEADADHKPRASRALQSLHEKREESREQDTRLNDTMKPLLHQYWELYRQKQGILEEQSQVADLPLTVHETVSKLIEGSSVLTLNLQRAQMTYLCQNFPSSTLASLLDVLKIGKMDKNDGRITFQEIPLEGDELDPSLSLVSLAVKATESESALPLYEIICRLVYKERPSQLVEFVHLCQRAREKGMDSSAFSRKKSMMQLYDIALGCLPGPDHSNNRGAAVLATAELKQHSSISHNALNALKLLLKHRLWSDAIDLVEKRSDNSQAHSELFQVLLTSILQEREIVPEFCNQLWACLPQKISSVEFLRLLTTHHQASNPRIHLCQQVLCQPQDDLQIGMVRDQLIKMLGQEKA